MITIKQCPREGCGVVATGKEQIELVFGYRRMKPGASPVPQSYCRACRKADADAKRAQAKVEREALEAATNEAIARTIRGGRFVPAPVELPPVADKVVRRIYGSTKHKPGEIVVLPKTGAEYIVGEDGVTITAVSPPVRRAS